MKVHLGCMWLALIVVLRASAAATDAPRLLMVPTGNQFNLRVGQEPVPPVGGTAYRLKLDTTSDLAQWWPGGELVTSETDLPNLTLTNNVDRQFFRLRMELEDTGTEPDGAELFGYNRIFNEELRAVGFLTPEQFAAAHDLSSIGYLPQLSFGPTTAQYWDAFNADPAVINQSLPQNSPDRRLYDFRLNPAEFAMFQRHGFVVSERLGSFSFADVFYRLFADDMPVFISADAILHAWHFSYQRLLEESEETQLAPELQQILDGMHAQLAHVPDSVADGAVGNSVLDADYFLTVARSLLLGQQVPSMRGGTVDEAVTNALTAVAQLQFVSEFPIFGTNRMVDFSQFKVRGHYEKSKSLGRYFQAFMWTARTDFRMLAAKPDAESLRELGTAALLCRLLQASGQAENWRVLDNLIRLFVGRTDGMTFAQLEPLLEAAGLQGLNSITSTDQLLELNQRIVEGNLGLQLISGDAYPFGARPLQLPRSFVLTGQRFNPDGWSLNQVIFNRINWNEEIPGYTWGKEVIRRYPSALDRAYSALGNEQVAPEIAQRMLDTAHRANFRDGLPYAHNLTALARTFNRIAPNAWEDSIANRWLAALRELSAPTTNARFPEAMRTRAWALRTVNTQLASYTELKHDTVLYAKQPYAAMIVCEYPTGFVEPVPSFWQKMKEMAEATAAALGKLPASGVIAVDGATDNWGNPVPSTVVDLGQRQAARIAFCQQFAQGMAVLQGMAAKELLQQPFSDTETLFIRGLMNRQDHPYTGPSFDGWYPGLFYEDYTQAGQYGTDMNGSNRPDPLVTDVATAPPDLIDPIGGVLHEGTGNPDLLLIAVDNGPDKMVYAGPVMSHYEFIVPGPALTRLTDSQWAANFPRYSGQTPPSPPARPDWTRSYLVPR